MTNPQSDPWLARRKASLARLDRWAYVLDDAVRIPGTDIRIGLDPILGFIPGVGDFAGVAMSSGLIFEALRMRAPKRIWLRMCANAGVDFVVGLVPVLGDIFDIAWRANRRNADLYRRWLEKETVETEPSSAAWGMFGISGGLLVALVVSVLLWHMLFG